MRAHQIQYTNFMYYTMNADTPGLVETGGYNRRLKNGEIKIVPFYRWRAGPIIETDRELDFVVDSGSRGFFTVQLPNTVGYTRDGRFDINNKGELVLMNGRFPVLGESGRIIVPEGAEITSATNGTLFADGELIERLKIAVFTDSGRDKLVSVNGAVFVLADERGVNFIEGEEHYRVFQHTLEQNNVLKAIVGDITMQKRSYEGIVKVTKVANRIMGSAVQLGNP